MNIFQAARLHNTKRIIVSRTEKIKREGSPNYTWTPGAIAVGASTSIYVPTQFPASRKYEPLDYIEIVNLETLNSLRVTINNGDTQIIPVSAIRTISGRGVALWHITITNLGAAVTTAGNIICTLKREPMTTDKWVQDNS